MILFDLKCGQDHVFEAWFRDSETYDAQAVSGEIACPLCGDSHIAKALMASLEPGGVLIYETFALGNERFGRPRNPDHLLKSGELLEAVRGHLMVIAYEDIERPAPKRAKIQRICAISPDSSP